MPMQMCMKNIRDKFEYHPDGYLILKKSNKPDLIGKRTGYKISSGYHCVTYERKMMRVHRIIFYLHHGYLPDVVDHINGDVDDNRIENLREVTVQQNTWNRGGCRGYEKYGNGYRVGVRKEGTHYRWVVDTEDDAVELREFLKQELHGEYVRC